MRLPLPEHLRPLVSAEQLAQVSALVQRAVVEERAACARIAEALAVRDRDPVAREIAYRIRARWGAASNIQR
jgi:hypothetical protein